MEIMCPHCNKMFNLDNDVADHIKDQIRTKTFEADVNARLIKEKELIEQEHKLTLSQTKDMLSRQYEFEIEKKNKKILELQTMIDHKEDESSLRIDRVRLDTEAYYKDIIAKLESEKKEVEYERDYYKDLKAKMSTKMVGETLEQHCELEFNKVRMMAFPNAEFHKDNLISKSSSSKGDYIFRDFDETGMEIVSIMFEMKNEMDTTSTKKKNAHFFKELDKDRREKNCEFAVLVSLLEEDNDLYNQGIVDVSYEYEKMYVIRPQFFIPFISLIRNASLRSMSIRKELAEMQNQNTDIKNFEESLASYKTSFLYNCQQADKHFDMAVDEIDKAIGRLNKIKMEILSASRQMRLANDKLDDITIKRLTANSPSLRKRFVE